MNEIYLYLLLGVLFYFLLSKILDKYLTSQENFDPSLVPVSSIVTLAKVAQKLVNGNGTLTNPGNLQIGKDNTAPGSLTVTGPTAIGTATPPVAGDPTLKVTGNTKISGTLDAGATTIIGNSTVTGSLGVSEELMGATLNAKNGTTNSTYKFIPGGSAYSDGISANALNLYAYGTNGTQNIANFNDNGTTELFGNTGIGGTLGVTGTTTLRSALGVAGNTTVGGTLGVTGNTTLTGNTTVGGTLGVTGVTTLNNTNISGGASITGGLSINGNIMYNGLKTIIVKGNTGNPPAKDSSGNIMIFHPGINWIGATKFCEVSVYGFINGVGDKRSHTHRYCFKRKSSDYGDAWYADNISGFNAGVDFSWEGGSDNSSLYILRVQPDTEYVMTISNIV
jgi:hypothetical protein